MKEQLLTTDEYDALEFIRGGARHDRFNACVGRNAKKLAGLKLIQYARDGKVALTDKGVQLLFLRRCIASLQALEADPLASVAPDVLQFLNRKSHIEARPEGGFALTGKGRESLADIAAQQPPPR
jgi:Mn-dependent DtxR family transcriptional regulator